MSNTNNLTLLILTPDYPDNNNKYIGSVFVKEQIEYLKEYFKKIIVISPVLCSFGILSNDKFCFNYTYDNVEIYYPRCFFIPNIVPYISFNHKMYFDFRYYAIQNCIIQNNLQFDLIHSHFTYPQSYFASILKIKYKIPYIMTINEDSRWLYDEISLNSDYIKQAWKDADKIITINSFDDNKISLYNPNHSIIPYGVNSRYSKVSQKLCREILHIPQDFKMIFSFGIFQKRKGFENLIKSVRILQEMNEELNLHCYIGGRPTIELDYERILKRLVIDLDVEDNVHFLGFLESSEIPAWINACDLYISSSYSEGLGITQLESIACGTPVIATKTTGSLSIITNPDIGLLCNLSDPDDLAKKILLGLNTQWDRNKIMTYAKPYRQENVSKQLLEVYKEVLK